ncbi:PREDICTED: uncharacterized protein At1g43920, Chloroplastic-like [Camelina sativa]|uniref:Uncharacterized protein At1g43920, Chloroplastic-like n=1 Tax=Camelina sativa TaxID=90675 RepID=A0ABM0WP01_CAMSA|nr:PREDICTED: uncharacterized protein At1g43920, Chloroplastic-like [Camelina sativa]
MELSSGSSSSSRYGGRKVCDCGLPAKIFKSKMARNPHRKFFGCELYKEGGNVHCKFFRWVDEEEVKGWPRQALVEAQAEINEKNRMISQLKSTIMELRDELEKHQLEMSLKNVEMETTMYRQGIIITGLTGLLVCTIGAIVFG